MTLQNRLLLLVMCSAPLVWLAGLVFSIDRARLEINELFDAELIRLSRQVQSTLPLASLDAIEVPQAAVIERAAQGDAELEDLAIAVWNRQGQLLLVDREGVQLPYQPQASGFSDMQFGSTDWRVFYLQSASGDWLIAVGQDMHERHELVWGLMAGQVVPWLLTLPVLLLVMAGAVKRALRPLHTLTGELDRRAPGDPTPLREAEVPKDLLPLVRSMNLLLERVARTLDHERRFTADAAHELRSPLAALQAQWEAAKLRSGAPAVGPAADKIGASLERMNRLVTQLLASSRLDLPAAAAAPRTPVEWSAVVEQVFNDVLPLADRRGVELACDWPAGGAAALPLEGEPTLVAAMLRNLLDNAVRHAPAGSTVRLHLGAEAIEVVDDGPGVAEAELPRLGHRFHRPAGAEEGGSGLGLSIVKRIAELHGLVVAWGNRADRSGFRVTLAPAR